MHFTCRSFIGKSGPKSWCQYWENEPDDPMVFQSRGHLFGLIAISSDDGQDIKAIGHQLINDLNSQYFSPTDLTIPKQLLESIQSSTKNLPQPVTIESLILVVICNQKLYLHLSNGGLFAVIRSGTISSPQRLIDSRTFYQLSGTIQSQDRLLLSTENFFKVLTWEKIKPIFTDPNLSSIEETTLSIINNLDDPNLVGSSLIEVHQEDDLIVATPPPQPVTNTPRRGFNFPKISLPRLPFLSAPKSPVYVTDHLSPQASHRQKFNLIIALILLIGLAVSITFGFQKNKANQAEIQYQKLQTTITKTLSDAFAIKNLNLETAKDLGKQSDQILSEMKNLKIVTHVSDIAQYQDQIRQLLSQTGVSDPTQSSAWYDTSLIVDQPQYSQIYYYQNSIYVVDTSTGRIDIVNSTEKSTKVFSQNSGLKIITRLLIDNNRVLGLTSNNIVEVSKSQTTPILSLSSVTDAALWNGTLYILDTANSTINKVSPNSTGFGTPAVWLKDDNTIPSNSSSIAINGRIWVLTADGVLIPYLRGVKDNFKPSQLIKTQKSRNLVTGPDTEIIAFIENDDTIYVYQKNGQTLAKFSLDNKKISSLTLDEANNVIYALCADQKIYKISL